MQVQRDRSPQLTRDEIGTTVRASVDSLHDLDEPRTRFLEGLAFVLMRIADADRRVLDAETRCMENILVEHADLPRDQAILVTEIARHRCRMADAGRSYAVSRDLRPSLNDSDRRRMLGFLERVAHADGHVCEAEHRAIRQIACELGIVREGPSSDA